MLQATNEARFWDRIARRYANDTIKDMPGYERTLERTRQFLSPSSTVLEIGCGTGTTALRLAPSVARIVASDISSEMISIAREKAAAQGCGNAVFELARADGSHGPESTYDAVLAFNLLHLIAGRQSTLANISRQLKPGGLFISKTPCLSEMNPLIRIAVPVMRLAGKAPVVSFFTAKEIEAEIAGAGFTITARERHGSGRKDSRIFIVAQKPAG